MSEDKNKIIDETEVDPLRKSQNRIISIILLFIIGLLLYQTGRDSNALGFVLFLTLFLTVNAFYLIFETVKYFNLKSKLKNFTETE